MKTRRAEGGEMADLRVGGEIADLRVAERKAERWQTLLGNVFGVIL